MSPMFLICMLMHHSPGNKHCPYIRLSRAIAVKKHILVHPGLNGNFAVCGHVYPALGCNSVHVGSHMEARSPPFRMKQKCCWRSGRGTLREDLNRS